MERASIGSLLREVSDSILLFGMVLLVVFGYLGIAFIVLAAAG